MRGIAASASPRFPAAARLRLAEVPLVAVGAVVLVLALALGTRIAFWWVQARSGAVQPADPEEYYRAALHILNGGYHDTGKWLRPPLYPAFLALMFLIGGIDVSFALLGQAILSGLGVVVFILLGRTIFARRDVALLSGAIAALFVPLASFGSVLFAEALFVMLLVLALALLTRLVTLPDRRIAFVCGIVLGLAALTRAVALYFIPLGVGLLLLVWWVRARSRWTVVVALLLGAILVIGPWTLRNYVVHERFIPVDTNGGISMWYGMVQGEADKRQGEARLAVVENLADRQALATRMTFERIADDPWLFVTRMRYKIASLFTLQLRNFATGELVTISPQDDLVVVGAGENSFKLTLVADAQYVLIMLLGIMGVSFAPSWRRASPVLLWFVFGVLISAVTVAHPRLRLPLVSVLIPFCAYALVKLPVALRRPRRFVRDRRTILTLAGCVLFLGLIFSWRYVTWLGGERYAVPARLALLDHDDARAQALFERAYAVDPDNALRLIDLADLAFTRWEYERAAELYRQATYLEHRNLYAHAMRIQTAALLDDPTEARVALAAIDSYGRDNNDLYLWAWKTARTPPPSQVIPGDPLALGHYKGFAPATFDLPQGRWTLGDGRVRVRGSCGTLTLDLRGPKGRAARVWVEDWGIRQQVLLSGDWQQVTLPLAGIRECEFHPPLFVHIESETALLDLERAPWVVGVGVRSVVVTR